MHRHMYFSACKTWANGICRVSRTGRQRQEGKVDQAIQQNLGNNILHQLQAPGRQKINWRF